MAMFPKLPQTSERIDILRADFSGMPKLEEIIEKTISRLRLDPAVQANVAWTEQRGAFAIPSFDAYFAEVVRKELGKVLGIIRNKAIAKARAAGAGSASTAVLRRMYRDSFAGNINIGGNRQRISSQKRVVAPPSGGKSGRRRERTVTDRTIKINEYYGPDRSFILRFLEGGTDVRTAKAATRGRGSKATYGNRGVISPRSFFAQMSSDMEMAANELGQTLIKRVEEWTEQAFTEIDH